MDPSTHPVEKEELMAYFDGELPVDRATAVRAHLNQCAECSALSKELRSVSERLAAWQVEPSPARLGERVTAALKERAQMPSKPRGEKILFGEPARRSPFLHHWVWGLAGGIALLLFVVSISIPNLLRSRMASDQARLSKVPTEPELGRGMAGAPSAQLPAGPMIVRTGALTLVSKEFENARAAIERVVRQHQGYIAQLTVSGHAGAGHALVATLRVPGDRLEAVIAELKNLGRVEQESLGGQEVTHQYVDLTARVSNGRNTEQRLIEVLRQRTGKVADILAVEQEIARVRGEIERLEAERKTLENQVRYATLQLQLREEYKAELQVAPASTGTRLRNSMVEGYRSAVESALGLLNAILLYGPSLLFWLLLLLWPARLAWRRLRLLVR